MSDLKDVSFKTIGVVLLVPCLTGALLWLQIKFGDPGSSSADLKTIFATLLAVLLGMFGAVVLAKIIFGQIDLAKLLSEANGDASMSRFQFMIFTYVIAGSYLLMQLGNGDQAMPDVPQSVLGLLGISVGGYASAKVIQKSAETSQAATVAQAATAQAASAAEVETARIAANPVAVTVKTVS